jgi:hypothetical protein
MDKQAHLPGFKAETAKSEHDAKPAFPQKPTPRKFALDLRPSYPEHPSAQAAVDAPSAIEGSPSNRCAA